MLSQSRLDQLTDAGLSVLAEKGMRGVTHRAVDAEAELPEGTCSNHFRTRDLLIAALGRRIYERLTPSPEYLESEADRPATRDQWIRLMVDLLDRARSQPELHLALLELRLEATRRPELVPTLSAVVREGLDADVTFHESSGLPGGRHEIVLLHLAIGGLITEVLTLPDALGIDDTTRVIESIVDRLVYGSPSWR